MMQESENKCLTVEITMISYIPVHVCSIGMAISRCTVAIKFCTLVKEQAHRQQKPA